MTENIDILKERIATLEAENSNLKVALSKAGQGLASEGREHDAEFWSPIKSKMADDIDYIKLLLRNGTLRVNDCEPMDVLC